MLLIVLSLKITDKQRYKLFYSVSTINNINNGILKKKTRLMHGIWQNIDHVQYM